MPIIWRLHMPVPQKLAVSGISSLVMITIAFETVRTVKIYQVDPHLTNLYSYLELLVSVIVGMLPSYRFMVSPAEKDREYRRRFCSRVTMRSGRSEASIAMQRYRDNQESRKTEASRRINVETVVNLEQEPAPPLPSSTISVHHSHYSAA